MMVADLAKAGLPEGGTWTSGQGHQILILAAALGLAPIRPRSTEVA